MSRLRRSAPIATVETRIGDGTLLEAMPSSRLPRPRERSGVVDGDAEGPSFRSCHLAAELKVCSFEERQLGVENPFGVYSKYMQDLGSQILHVLPAGG